MATIKYIYIDDEGFDVEGNYPAHWEICQSCYGEGTTTSHIEPVGGGFTSSEWAEACYDNPDFAEDYFSGKYDRPCPRCDGGKVLVPDLDSWPDEAKKSWIEKEEYEAEERAAQRMRDRGIQF